MYKQFPRKSYQLDERDRFVWLSAEWDQEFQHSLSSQYAAHTYIGRNFFDLLAGPEIAGIYQALFKVVRHERPRVDLTLRCDRPDARAFLSLEIVRTEKLGLVVALDYLSLERYEHGPGSPPSRIGGILRMCSWCQGIYDGERNFWLPIEQALCDMRILHQEPLSMFSHGCCPSCFEILRGKTDAHSGG